jgi:hypothetical protein
LFYKKIYAQERRMLMKNWLKAAGIRAVKTVAQTAIATIGTSEVMVASAASLAGILSLLMSVSGIPELKI